MDTDTNGLVSIVIPVYNVEPYLRECVDSVICQTYKNLEIILVDDGSEDGSGAICDEYAMKDQRIHVIHQSNGGSSAARNCGLDASHGEFIYFMDSDDYIAAETIECLVEAINEDAYEFVFFEGVVVREGEEENEKHYEYDNMYSKKQSYTSHSAYQLLYQQLINGEFCPCVWIMFFKRSFLTEHRIYFCPGIIDEDVLYSFLVYHKGNKAKFVPHVFYFHRKRMGSIMDSNDGTPEHFKSMATVYNHLNACLRHSARTEASRIFMVNTAKRVCLKYQQLGEHDKERYKRCFRRFRMNVLLHFAYGSSSLRLLCLPKPLRFLNEWKIRHL